MYTPRGYYETNMKNIKVTNRIKRIVGQIDSLLKKIELGEDCEPIINQFLAVRGGINAALNEYLSLAITECTHKDKEQLQRLIKTLVKN